MKNKVTSQHQAAVRKLVTMIVACVLAMAAGAARAQALTATNFTIVNDATGQPLSLSDYQGNVILLDFWAYWCLPCQEAASDIEPNITQYYRNMGGNDNGVPVQVLSINIDCGSPSFESNFIYTFGLEVVGDDCSGVAFSQYDDGAIPQFAVINGTTNSSNYGAWQILYSNSNYGYTTNSTVPALKSYIDSVQTPAPIVAMTYPANGASFAPPTVALAASLATNGKIIQRVEFYDGATLIGSITNTDYLTITNNTASTLTWNANYSLTWSNVAAGAKSVSARAYYGAGRTVNSSPVNFTVTAPTIVASLSMQGTNLLLSWSGGAGTYQVQSVTNLYNGSWQNCGTAGTYTNLTLAPSNTACFYRVIMQ